MMPVEGDSGKNSERKAANDTLLVTDGSGGPVGSC